MQEDTQRAQSHTVPPQIEQYIRNGIKQANLVKQKRRRRYIRLGSGAAACMLLLSFFFSIKLSPAVAAYVSHIPGMEKLVELISDDKGMRLAVEHNMVQSVGASTSLDGVSFTIDQVLMDQKRMLVFYTLQSEKLDQHVSLDKIELTNPNGKDWQYGISWSPGNHKEASVSRDRFDVYISEDSNIPETLTAKVTVAIDNAPQDTPLYVSFAIDKTKYVSLEKQVYPVMKEVTVDGLHFTIEQIAVFPTQTEVSILFDPANKKHVFDFDQLRLVDEKGQNYAFWGNGVPSRAYGENGMVYNLESTYFVQPAKLYLKANGIRAIDKDKLEVVIDAKAKTLVKAPDTQLQLDALRQTGDGLGMDFTLEVAQQDVNHFYGLVNELTDDLGNEYDYVQGTSSTRDKETTQSYGYWFKRLTNKGEPSFYTFTLNNYPIRLHGDFSVQVK
ncbi:DUF4179 domain-containing protein [Brevibacillus reuszeri]|uniref:DUF4179 domain-containing protein n=1 Tax=Brevibacillus reuszeri TaxID=54915 RepID=UPI003D23C646